MELTKAALVDYVNRNRLNTDELIADRLGRLAAHNKLSSPFIKKAEKYLHSKAFIYKETRDRYYTFFIYDRTVTVMELYSVKTSKGTVYIVVEKIQDPRDPNKDKYVFKAFTAHFFDRYSERLNLGKNRDKTLREFLKREVTRMAKTPVHAMLVKNGNVIDRFVSGLGLGVDMDGLPFMKTFIGNDDMRDEQKNLNEVMRSKEIQLLLEKQKEL